MNINKKWKRIIIFFICLTIFSVMIIVYNRKKQDTIEDIIKTSIFSWEDIYLLPENEDSLNETMHFLECEALYQMIPSDVDEIVLKDFLTRRKENKQDVYYLTGKAEWGVENKARSMLEEVERVIEMNDSMEESIRFVGIVFDVEPYLVEEWDDDRDKVMKQYVANCLKVYQETQKSGLRLILCIPNFYDRLGYDEELSELVRDGCDALAIMNYNKADESGQIEEEMKSAKLYDKGIIHITEMQKPGKHGLLEENTYYHDGIDAVKKSWQMIEKETDYENLGFSWHYLRPIIKIIERDE